MTEKELAKGGVGGPSSAPDLLECTRCGHESTDDHDQCPKCGCSFRNPKEKKMSKAAEVVDIKNGQEKVGAQTVKELRDLENKIDTALSDHVLRDWEIGQHLSKIQKGDLWRAATDQKGEPFKSFAEYAQSRFDFGKDTARAYVAIADTFNKEQAAELSITQLWHLARVKDESDRAKLVKQVKAGKYESTRELAAAVKAKRAEKGLKTERAGMEGVITVSARLKPGKFAEGEWRETRSGGGYIGEFELGGARIAITRPKRGNTFEVKVLPPKS